MSILVCMVVGFLLGRFTGEMEARRRHKRVELERAVLRLKCDTLQARLLELVEVVRRDQAQKKGKRDGRAVTN